MTTADQLGAATLEERIEALERDNRALRLQFLAALVTLLIFCASLNVYLFRQTSGVRKHTSEAAKFVATYTTNTAPQLGIFVGRLQDYAKRDLEFRKVLDRYINPTDAAPVAPQAPVTQPFGK